MLKVGGSTAVVLNDKGACQDIGKWSTRLSLRCIFIFSLPIDRLAAICPDIRDPLVFSPFSDHHSGLVTNSDLDGVHWRWQLCLRHSPGAWR